MRSAPICASSSCCSAWPCRSNLWPPPSSQRIARFPWQVPIDSNHLGSRPHIPRIDEGNRTRNGRHQLIGHVVGVHHFWRGSRFRAKDLRDPELFELRFRHLIDDLENHVPLSRHGCAEQQHYGQVCIPVLPFTSEYF